MSYTPGPWTATQSHGGYFSLDAADGTLIVGGCGCCSSPFMEGKSHEADARLIAAAPDLLEALQLAGSSAGFQYMTHETREAIDAAIAKATGEQQ